MGGSYYNVTGDIKGYLNDLVLENNDRYGPTSYVDLSEKYGYDEIPITITDVVLYGDVDDKVPDIWDIMEDFDSLYFKVLIGENGTPINFDGTIEIDYRVISAYPVKSKFYPESAVIHIMDKDVINTIDSMYHVDINDTSNNDFNESVKIKYKSGRKALKEELSDIKQEWEEFLSDGGNNVIEFDDGDYVFFDVDFDKGTIYAGSATNTGILREYEINLDSDLNLDENIAELYDEIVWEKEQEKIHNFDKQKIGTLKDGKELFIDTAYGDGYQLCLVDSFGNYNPYSEMGTDNNTKIINFDSPEDVVKFAKETYGDKLVLESLNKSKSSKNLKLVEGPGAGYSIEGQLTNIHINNFTYDVVNKVGSNVVVIDCDIDAVSEDTDAYSYYYGDKIGNVPVKITNVEYYLEDEEDIPKKPEVAEDLKFYLDGCYYSANIGGGWTHETFYGKITAGEIRHYNHEFSPLRYIEMECTDEGDILYIDDVVTGEYEREDEVDESVSLNEAGEDNGLTKTILKAIKKGTYFTFKPVEDPSENIVYVKDEYDRESRKYGYYKWSDVNNWHEKKGDTVVYTGFTF